MTQRKKKKRSRSNEWRKLSKWLFSVSFLYKFTPPKGKSLKTISRFHFTFKSLLCWHISPLSHLTRHRNNKILINFPSHKSPSLQDDVKRDEMMATKRNILNLSLPFVRAQKSELNEWRKFVMSTELQCGLNDFLTG